MKTYNFIATVYLLSNVLHHLSILNLVFQKEEVDLSVIQLQVQATISSLKLLPNQPGPFMQKVLNVIEELSRYGVVIPSDNTKT